MFEAFRDRRRADAEALLAPEFRFTSPYDDAIDRAAFFAACWPNGDRISGFEIEQITADNDGAFITYFCTVKEGTSFSQYRISDRQERTDNQHDRLFWREFSKWHVQRESRGR